MNTPIAPKDNPDSYIQLARKYNALESRYYMLVGLAIGELLIIVVLAIIVAHLEYLQP